MENNVKVKAERETKKFMKDVNSYLAKKAGGKVPPLDKDGVGLW